VDLVPAVVRLECLSPVSLTVVPFLVVDDLVPFINQLVFFAGNVVSF
jgi:hypothetical protein